MIPSKVILVIMILFDFRVHGVPNPVAEAQKSNYKNIQYKII